MRIPLTLNGTAVEWWIEPGETLLDALRRHGCRSVKRGCETGDCGACTVLLDGQPVNSCVVLAARARGAEVRTLEGLRDDPLLQRLEHAFVAAGAVQCGYCTPGMLISMYVLLGEGGELDEEAVRHALSGNLCRCTGYVKPVRAVLAAWKEGA
jgi:aerobic-type carbon monoxide dehydrogenase small subunit (CoxS/CutS family)